MQSEAQTNTQDINAAGPLRWSEACGWTRQRHVELEQQHRDLDDVIFVLSHDDACDEALIARLKKRKLQIKDEMFRLEAAVAA